MRQRIFLSLISIFLLMGSAYADDKINTDDNINTVISQVPVGYRTVNHSLDSEYKLPYAAVTSQELSMLVGFWQSDDDEEKLVPYILKRAVSICAQDNGELVDFEIETTDDNGKFVVLDDKSKRVTNDDNVRWLKSSSNPRIAANLDSLGVDLILEKIRNVDLSETLNFKHVYFKKVTCVNFNSENLTKEQFGDQKLKYYCPKIDTTKPYCDKFKSFGQFQCFRYGKNNLNSTDEQSIKYCEKITDNVQATCVNSALESKWRPNLKYTTEHCSRISTPYQGMAVMKALESLDLKDSVNQVLKLKTDEQYQIATKAMDKLSPDLAVEVALKIENKAQAEFAIKSMQYDTPQNAVENALKIENKAQAEFAIKSMQYYTPQDAVENALKIKTDIQANLLTSVMKNTRYPPRTALELTLSVTNSHHAKTAIHFMEKRYTSSYSIVISSSISQAFQANVAVKAFNKGYKPFEATNQAMLIENEFQSKVAVKAMDQWEPDLAVEVALKISTSEQAARALEGMNKNKWDPGYAVQKALE